MDWIGWVCIFIIICYSSYPDKVNKLESKVKKLERNEKGDSYMSKIMARLIGKKCKITTEDGLSLVGNSKDECTIIDVDDEWVEFTYSDKKDIVKTKIIRIDSIENVEVITE